MLAAMRPWLHETLISSDEDPMGVGSSLRYKARMTTKTKTATGVDRLGLQRLATVACFGALVLGLTPCGTLSGAARVDSALYVGPPRTIEAALPGEADLASAPFAAPEREARLVAAASADTATDAAPQSAHPVADIPGDPLI
jgi:hypothetical protein